MDKIFETPVLQAGNKKGLRKYWVGRVLSDGTAFFTQTEAWQDTKDGGTSTPLISTPKRIEGKNIGRANETTPEAQARREIDALFLKQKDKGYALPGEEERSLALPMLAHPYEKYTRYASFPCYVQPKLDGVRCLYNPELGFWSRQGKLFLSEVTAHLAFATGGLTLDGELMLPHEHHTFQETIQAIKKWYPALSPQLRYFVYDLIEPELPFSERFARLQSLFADPGTLPAHVLPVPTRIVDDEDALKAAHAEFIAAGFEGTMVRNAAGRYLVGHRSQDLLKKKDFVDDEYLIVDVLEGEAKEAGHAIFVCVTPAGQRFNVRPRGTSEERQRMFRERERLIGRELKVSYQNLSDDGVPRFPVGIAIRDREIEG